MTFWDELSPDPAADRVAIVDAMRREECSTRARLNSAIAELYVLRQRKALIDRREVELMNRIAMLERGA